MDAKICLLGAAAVGKTSLVHRFTHNMFNDKYASPVGIKVSRKTVGLAFNDGTEELTMLLWDLAGNRGIAQIRASYLRNTAGAVLVCDLTRPSTLDSLQRCVADLFSVSPNAQIVLAANKCDLLNQQQLAQTQVEAMAATLNAPYYFTSAKTGDAVGPLFRHLGRLVIRQTIGLMDRLMRR